MKREGKLIKHDMTRDNYFTCDKIKATITAMIREVPEKHARRGARGKFVRGGGGGV